MYNADEKKDSHSIELTTGSLWKNILLFSLPLMGSQVLEVLFNLSDVAVVGRFADYMALGAVGSTTLFMDGSIAASRGIGKSIPPTIIVILGSCIFRIVWIYTVFAHFQTISSLYLLYIFSWGITGLAETLFFAVSFKKLRVVK